MSRIAPMGKKRTAHGPVKHSLTLAGHRTSLSLEPDFWIALGEIADARGISLAGLVAEIDAKRAQQGLSSAARVFVLNTLRGAERPPTGRTG